MCSQRHAKFNSRRKLFKHLEAENLMVRSEGDEDEHINRVANKEGSIKTQPQRPKGQAAGDPQAGELR